MAKNKKKQSKKTKEPKKAKELVITDLKSEYNQEQLEFERFKNNLLQKLSCYTFKHPALKYIINTNPSYEEYVEYLLFKNGIVEEDYVVKNQNGMGYRKNIKVTKEGFEVHHIYENQIANLSDPIYFPFSEFQKAGALVYADYLEHAILHYLITKETWNTFFQGLGWGGLFNYHMYERTKLILDNEDYEYFGYLIAIISLPMAKKVDEVNANTSSNDTVAPSFITRISADRELYSKILYNFPYGISSISVEDYKNLGMKTGSLTNAKEILILRSAQDNIMFIEKSNSGKLLVLNGGVHKSLKHTDPNWYLEKMDAYYSCCNEFMQLFDKCIQPIVNLVKQSGGSGYVHGTIIDYDYFHHIKLDFENNIIIPYFALNVGSRTIFPSFEVMAQQSLNMSTGSQTELVKYEENTGIQGLTTPICQKAYSNQDKGFYAHQKAFVKLQRAVSTKIIKSWEEKYENDAFWIEYAFNNKNNILQLTEEPS